MPRQFYDNRLMVGGGGMMRPASSGMDSLGMEVAASVLTSSGLLFVFVEMDRGIAILFEEVSAKWSGLITIEGKFFWRSKKTSGFIFLSTSDNRCSNRGGCPDEVDSNFLFLQNAWRRLGESFSISASLWLKVAMLGRGKDFPVIDLLRMGSLR